MANLSANRFLNSKAARILTAVLIIQAAILYGFSRKEMPPQKLPLKEVPLQIASWQLVQEVEVEKEILEVLKADETLSRTYASGPHAAHLFVAYFSSQRTGQSPHSPKNCLPAAGWMPSVADEINIPIDGREPIPVNRYIIAKGAQKSVVLYWYQSRDRVVASEYAAKFYAVADAMRYNRSDTALVRVVVPVQGNNERAANELATQFVRDIFKPLRQYFPA